MVEVTNLIISTLFMLNLTNTNLIDTNKTDYQKPTNITKEYSMFKENSRILLLNSYSLIYTDIFLCTKPNYHSISSITTNYHISLQYSESYITNYLEEGNLIADELWKLNLWVPTFVAVNLLNSCVVDYLDSKDSSGILGYCYITTISLVELLAINTWKDQKYTKDITINIPLVNIMF